MLKRVLIANRGEIALRVVRACKVIGVESVAVCSDADAQSMHVKLADYVVHIGPADAKRSYLNLDAIIGAALLSKADAIHPGYGFLAENAHFAQRCVEAGLVFVGPCAETIRLMADKARARRTAIAAGVPVIPGTEDEATSDRAVLAHVAENIGYPVMLKAAAGGGGRGMTRISNAAEFDEKAMTAMAEAQSAFGDGRMYIEKCIENARHVEVQVLCDGKETYAHLGERDCSVQRRHQKLIEEAPSPGLASATRQQLTDVSIELCEAVKYAGAGTIEFLVDMTTGEFYFIEMNTRIQVEHPVTEMLTGTDLVVEQLAIAGGQSVSFAAAQPLASGHAIELRVSAEDPEQGFAPAPGRIESLVLPSGPGIRVDSHCEEGTVIPPYYDSMIAKIIAWGETRELAIDRLIEALKSTRIEGVPTTIPAGLAVLADPDFRAGNHHTQWFEKIHLGTASGRVDQ
ncbi:MAG: acetyl-CoA carboxylase biotin carboxylase subunit [Chromatiales bacterium]|jgi:acetyl-CoA carboxylase, biotin carboxylase subunit|nr:acetyl-CoA carboxylase biotin carboxylase subunit [Chromatiales bacterium]